MGHMKICIFGAGGVGGYFGGRLAQAGSDVTFIARGKHLDAILADGLRVKSIEGDFTIVPAKATKRIETVGVADVVLCCVKSWQVAEAAESIRPVIGPETMIIPLQNGVEAHTILSQSLGAAHVLPGVCRLITMIDRPGHIRHTGAHASLAFGEMDGQVSDRAKKVKQAFDKARGMAVHVSRNIDVQLWRKFMLIAPWGGMGALTRSPIGIVRTVTETREMLMASIREVYDVARANHVAIEKQALSEIIDFIDKLPADGTASMQRDITDCRPSELHEQCGAIVRYGERGGVRTPVNRFIYHSLLPQEQMARGALPGV
jgi:2-dehydropantoate 2-reductase